MARKNYTATDEIFISFYLKIAALPSGQVRLARIADQGTHSWRSNFGNYREGHPPEFRD